MKLWEVILYAILGGITELLPISFSGHALIFRNAMGIRSLSEGEGFYIRACICLGLIIALYLVFHHEAKDSHITLRRIRSHKPGRPGAGDIRLKLRVNLLSIFALIPMLLSFIFLQKAESVNQLTYVAGIFLLNTLLLFASTRGPAGNRDEKDVTLFDALLIGLFRMISVFPGLSSVGSSLCVGRLRGFSDPFNLKFTYLLCLGYEIAAFIYYVIRGILYGSFLVSSMIPCVLAVIFTTVAGYFTLLYFRNLFLKNKLRIFTYYCIDIAAIAFIIAIING